MVNYPGLSQQQQRGLPALLKPARSFDAKFEDSTHQLWHCETVDGALVLKLCNQETVRHSTFWQGMNSLFAADFPASLAHSDKIYRYVGEQGLLTIPEYIAAESSSFVLASYLDGDDVCSANVSGAMVDTLAEHIAQLHQQRNVTWGAFHHAKFPPEEWSKSLQATLLSLANSHSAPIPDAVLKQALEQAEKLKNTLFSPIMMDLRWDQMLHQQGRLSAVVDMDAFVMGPRELELVLLEYQLNAEQAERFKLRYQKFCKLPDLNEQRFCYRLLLFLMNSLGESDIEKWMNMPIRW
ncbi:aminoglycoside phosphotransferase family protein [Pseudomonadota bacterium]|nr:aminoglycoside phosphotransferase family protein [Pseudomonadota bacterium]